MALITDDCNALLRASADQSRKRKLRRADGYGNNVRRRANSLVRRFKTLAGAPVAALLLLAPILGCAVPQPRGQGALTHEVEPQTKRGYWLYLPKPYIDATEAERRRRRWPLVVTFHGMKPFDNAYPQAREWQQEADRYGFVVVAPQLRAPDVFGQFPLRTVTRAFKSDELATLEILKDVFAKTDADPSNVLSTSWSSGGYMAHYMMNRHPARFTCLAVRQSNFSASVLDEKLAPLSIYHPILILNTQNDFAVCLRESAEAVKWYEAQQYRNAFWIKIKALGHARTPDMAADFFGRVAGVRPLGAPSALARRAAIDGNPEGLALLAGNIPDFKAPPPQYGDVRTLASLPPTPRRNTQVRQRSNRQPVSARRSGLRPMKVDRVASRASAAGSKPRGSAARDRSRGSRQVARAAPEPSQVTVRVSAAIGLVPLHLGFSADCPSDWVRSSDFLWTLDGQKVCSGINGQKTITKPGTYELGVLVVTADGAEHRASRNVRVLPRLTRRNAGSE